MHSERQVEQYNMSEKKVIAFIVEGASDEAALGTIMKEYFSNNKVQSEKEIFCINLEKQEKLMAYLTESILIPVIWNTSCMVN